MQSFSAMDTFKENTGAPLPDGYSFLRVLGEGPIAQVFLVRNTSLKRLAALKVLRKELAADSVSRRRFLREAQAAARITHPAVTSIYATGALDNDLPFIEMQYIDGRNLADELKARGRIGASETRIILTQLANALSAAHEMHIIHRAIEPANVMLDRNSERAFLTDFGIAGILESGTEAVTKLTRVDERLGNPRHMSPEQLRADVVTEQSDIYAFGLLGYEMLTLRSPFGDAASGNVVAAHIRRPPIKLHEVDANIPADLSDLLKRCLSKKPENRPSTRDLVRFFSSAPQSRQAAYEGGDPSLQGAIAGFLGELQDRKVYRAAVAYAAVVFVILQVADLVFSPLNIPDWVYRLVVIVSLAAFPFVLALAWIFDWHQGRLTRTEDDDRSFEDSASPRQQYALQAVGLVFSIAVSGAIAWWLLNGG